jgi:hypothetical protein
LQQANRVTALRQCTQLTTLVANHCNLSWDDAVLFTKCFPCLRELYLAENKVEGLGAELSDGHPLRDLDLLDLMDNQLEGWQSVVPLTQIKSLRTLKLSGNPLGSLSLSGLHSK